MFTGLIEEVGAIVNLRPQKEAVELQIEGRETLRGAALGDSIAVDGICLTVTSIGGGAFTAFASAETLRRTNLVLKQVGDRVNLERPLTLEKRLGGHMVQGHVDGVATLAGVKREGESQVWKMTLAADLAKFLVTKGSVAVDGVSLTVVDAEPGHFTVALIPKTLTATTFQFRKVGDLLNIETDIIGKYVRRFMYPEENAKVAEPPAILTALLDDRLAS